MESFSMTLVNDTEFQLIQSEIVLGDVVKALDLNKEWAKKYGMDSLKTTETIAMLKGRMDLPAIPQTGLGAGCFFREANFFLCCLSELPRKLTPPLRETTPPP